MTVHSKKYDIKWVNEVSKSCQYYGRWEGFLATSFVNLVFFLIVALVW